MYRRRRGWAFSRGQKERKARARARPKRHGELMKNASVHFRRGKQDGREKTDGGGQYGKTLYYDGKCSGREIYKYLRAKKTSGHDVAIKRAERNTRRMYT